MQRNWTDFKHSEPYNEITSIVCVVCLIHIKHVTKIIYSTKVGE